MTTPTVYLLHGDDPFAIQQFLQDLLAKMGDPGTAELNTTRLDGSTASETDLQNTALALPFLSDRRLVILTNPLAKLTAKAAQERFIRLLESLPPTTALVLVVTDHHSYRGWETLHPAHWLLQWAQKHPEQVLIRALPLPPLDEMPGWIQRLVKARGGEIEPRAAAALTENLGNDTLLTSQEIDKLLTYVDGERSITVGDVELLTAPGSQADIFKMVDALASGDGKTALRMLHTLLEDGDEFSLFGMVVRQFRLLLQAREVMDAGGGASAIASELKLTPFVAGKLHPQAQRFTQLELEAIYHRLLEMDEAAKTSATPLALSLELLIADLSR